MTAPAKVWEAQRRINERDARIAELEAERDTLRAEMVTHEQRANAAMVGMLEARAERDQLNAALAETAARCDTYRAERDRLRTLLAEVAASGVEFDDDRLNYVTIQVPRPVWVDIKALEE